MEEARVICKLQGYRDRYNGLTAGDIKMIQLLHYKKYTCIY